MADELKRRFREIQEEKSGKKNEMKIDEFEWIEVWSEPNVALFTSPCPFSSTNNWQWTENRVRNIRRQQMRN